MRFNTKLIGAMSRKRPDNPGMHTVGRDPGFHSRVQHRIEMTRKRDEQRAAERLRLEAEMAAYQAAPSAVLIKADPSRVSKSLPEPPPKPEKRLKMREGIYVLPGGPHTHVRITLKSRSGLQYILEDVNPSDGRTIPGTSRNLTLEIKKHLKPLFSRVKR